MDNYIFLIHGLSGIPITLLPMKWTLQKRGYKNVHIISYSSISLSLENATNTIYEQIKKIADNKKIILVGHSFGGVISYNLSKNTNLNISLLILVASPLKSCTYLENINSFLPLNISNFIRNKIPALDDLLKKKILK